MSAARIADVKLSSMDVSWRTTWDVVTIETDDGTTGTGEWSDAASHTLAYPLAEEYARDLIGMKVDEALDVVQRDVDELPSEHSAARRLRATVLGGLDAALCDIAAQIAKMPLSDWLKGNLDAAAEATSVPLYANINRAVRQRTPGEFARQARAAVDAGFTAIKCAPFDFLVGAHRIRDGLALARAAREAIGDDMELLLDLHGQVQVDEIVATADQLIGLRPGWIEDVTTLNDLSGLRAVRQTTGLPIAAGEFVAKEAEIAPALDAGLVDIFMPDVKHIGGPRRALQLGRFAAAAGARVSPHNPCGPVATAHTAAVCAALDKDVLEFAFGEWSGRAEVLAPTEPVKRGGYVLGPRLGLGHALSDAQHSSGDAT